ncbi:MAG: hypothetical protein RBR87_06955 [Bacteroidales bacterium]|jgi:hypothetical protein|nr:hypothetical protein [Bacteroidales bacterium]
MAKNSTLSEFTKHENSSIYIIGGDSFLVKPFYIWNFSSSNKELIEEAKQ